jgi:hypothetical protein
MFRPRLFTFAFMFLVVSACTFTGEGTGQLAASPTQNESAVHFNWKGTGTSLSGTMTATLSDTVFAGQFFEITKQTRTEVLAPLWEPWRPGWRDWHFWGYPSPMMGPVTQFVTRYSGKVVANLEAPGNLRMRCRFHLMEPSRGMSGGGEGECQISDGRTVHAVFESQ